MSATFGDVLRIRRTFENNLLAGWGGRIRTSVWRNQNPLPYHLATPQFRVAEANAIGLPIMRAGMFRNSLVAIARNGGYTDRPDAALTEPI